MKTERVSFRMAFAICAIATLLPLWTVKYLPMIDLPQHAAQISIINHLNDPAWGFADLFYLNWFIPYALVYYVGSLFAGLFGIFLGLKILISLYVVAMPLSIRSLLKQTGGDPWWSLLGFPLAYGYSFYWGFLNFLIATPLAIFAVSKIISFVRLPTWRDSGFVFLLCSIVFFSHGLAYALVMIIYGALFVTTFDSWRLQAIRMAPVIPLTILTMTWYALPQQQVPPVTAPAFWGWGLERLLELPVLWIGNSEAGHTQFFGLLFLTAFLVGSRFGGWSLRLLLPVLVALVAFFAGPHHAMDITFVYQRYPVFVFVFSLLLFKPALSSVRIKMSRMLILATILLWNSMLMKHFLDFDAEGRDCEKAMQSIDRNKNILAIIKDGYGGFANGSLPSHLPCYYQALKGGGYWFSFASVYKSVARFKPGKELNATFDPKDNLVWDQTSSFDYVIVRSTRDKYNELFSQAPDKFKYLQRRGNWWLYERT